jgi:tetratricopeptide (TPR) repeat protein
VNRIFPIALCALLAVSLASCGGGKGVGYGEPARVVTHKVVPGESWESISVDFYGSASRAADLAVFNGSETSQPPPAGTGIRVPLSPEDLDALDSRLDAAAVYNEGLERARRGDYAGSVEKFEQALDTDPGFHEASFNLAVTYQKLGMHDRAEGVLDLLVTERPGYGEYWFALGNSQFHQGHYSKAARSFRRALDLDPEYLRALYSLAVSLEKMGEKERAVSTWRRYLELDPDSEWADEARKRMGTLEKKR